MDSNVGGSSNVSTLTVGNGDKDGEFSGTMADNTAADRLGLTKVGGGTQQLTGECTFTGVTRVEGGTLVVNTPTYASEMAVYAGGTLRGNTAFGSKLWAIDAGAIIAPGNSTGTISVDDDADLGPGTLSIELDDTAMPKNDLLEVAGSLRIGDTTLDVTMVGTASQPAYVIATYGTLIGGTFATANIPSGYEIDYDYLGGSQIALVATATDYDTWAGGFGLNPLTDGAAGEDPDMDGLINEREYAFGLSPISAASVTAFTTPLNKTAGTFTYTRRNPALTELTYSVETSTTLDVSSWTPAGASENVIGTAGDVQTVKVTLSGAPLDDSTLFARVVADQ